MMSFTLNPRFRIHSDSLLMLLSSSQQSSHHHHHKLLQKSRTLTALSSSMSFAPSLSSKCSVFLNFRGKDTRDGFVKSLHEALSSEGIHTFKDDVRLKKGDHIQQRVFDAIEESRVAILVLSEGYASSEWCLDELVKIMQRRKKINELSVFPVFYNVRPSDVRYLRGSFADAFAEHEERYKDNRKRVETWKRCLYEATGFLGFDISNAYNGDESKCIQNIVEEVHETLGLASYNLGKCLNAR